MPADVHLEWSKPLSLDEALACRGPADYGVYQIYGTHPVYGDGVLLYIGKAERQRFGIRLEQEPWWQHNSGRLEVHLGRILDHERGGRAVDDAGWARLISDAERLLIYAHAPASNSAGLNLVPDTLPDVHVVNWGHFRRLLPEVSGKAYRLGHRPPVDWHPLSDRE